MNIFINDTVETPDGKAIVKKIEELYLGNIGYTCLLEKPYTYINKWSKEKDYNFPSYSFGYMYDLSQLKLLENNKE